MNFLQNILTLKPREESGSKTSRKYRFQKDLSLFLLIDHHNSQDDYLFLFDFHEDLVILDSSSIPSKANFYQIKSKDGDGKWTLNKILKKDGEKHPHWRRSSDLCLHTNTLFETLKIFRTL